MSEHLERTPTPARCQVCAKPTAGGEIRVVQEHWYTSREDDLDERVRRAYFHVQCAVESRKPVAHGALISRATLQELFDEVVADVERVDATLARDTRAWRAREFQTLPKRLDTLEGKRTNALLTWLQPNPHDRTLLLGLADELDARGDPRGELIRLDLDPPLDPEGAAHRRALTAALSPDLPGVSITQGIGFLRRLRVAVDASLAEAADVLAHPACRLLETLAITSDAPGGVQLAVELIPRSLRFLHIFGNLAPDQKLAELPHLDAIQLNACTALAHPSLRKLRIERATSSMIKRYARTLPAVRSLRVSFQPANTLAVLRRTGWLDRLEELMLSSILLGEGAVDDLEAGLGKRKLARLAIHHCGLALDLRPRLQAMCDQLDFVDVERTRTGDLWIEHTAKPEWGRGKVLRESGGKLEVEFVSGKKTFKADSPFLKRIRT